MFKLLCHSKAQGYILGQQHVPETPCHHQVRDWWLVASLWTGLKEISLWPVAVIVPMVFHSPLSAFNFVACCLVKSCAALIMLFLSLCLTNLSLINATASEQHWNLATMGQGREFCGLILPRVLTQSHLDSMGRCRYWGHFELSLHSFPPLVQLTPGCRKTWCFRHKNPSRQSSLSLSFDKVSFIKVCPLFRFSTD